MKDLVDAKKERNEILKDVLKQPQTTSKEFDSVQMQCLVFASSISALPSHLQKRCRREIQTVIDKYEDEADALAGEQQQK